VIGQTLGLYRVLKKLGEGAMGDVYLAEDIRLKRRVALKVLSPHAEAHPDRLARFEREAQAIAALNHPGIVTLYSVDESDGVRSLTMELVEGRTLSQEIAAGGMDGPRFFAIAIPLIAAVAAVHERGSCIVT
jgi:serine/threonine-protein kinase